MTTTIEPLLEHDLAVIDATAEVARLREINADLLAACKSMMVTCGGSENWNGETHKSLLLIEDAVAKAEANQ